MKRIPKKVINGLAIVGAVVLVTVVTRAVSVMTEEKRAGDLTTVGPSNLLRAIWLELRQVFMFSRY